ncbi:hypothetical protein QP64_00080, partial [Staphylococcus aureus]
MGELCGPAMAFSLALLSASNALVERGHADSPQTDLHHHPVVEGRGRRRYRGIGVVGDIVHRQHEAVVNVARADDVLIDLVGLQVVAEAAGDHPV